MLLAFSFLLAAGAWKAGYISGSDNGITFKLPDFFQISADRAGEESFAGVPKADEPEVGTEMGAEQTALPEQTAVVEEEVQPETVRQAVTYEADISWFDDALFIGDSRTVGLFEYGDLGSAEVLAESGMSVYKIFKKEFAFSTGEKGTLEELLAQRQFGKIYLMLGINEIGYSFETTVTRYGEMVERIQQIQPDALIFLEANLHISKKKSETSAVYNNANIDRFNQEIAALSDNESRFYLDVNELFDDEEGNLAEEYTADDAHVLAVYYPEWVSWLLKHAVKFEEV